MMIKSYVMIGAALLLGTTAMAQKDELKSLKKIYNREEVSAKDAAEYKVLVQKLKPLATEEGDKTYAAFYEANVPMVEISALGATATPAAMANLMTPQKLTDYAKAANQVIDFETKSGKKLLTDEIKKRYEFAKPMMLSYAVTLGEAKRFNETADILYAMYTLDKTDIEKLYFAANYAVNGQDYDKAFGFYNDLKRLNYSGEGMAYYATNLVNDKEEFFNNKTDRDRFVQLKTHNKPRDEKIPSKRGEIYKNIALILVQKGKIDEAKKAIKDAREQNPDDSSLILSEANLYLETKDFDTYKKLINESLAKDPNNKDLIFNLGVIAYNNKEIAEAEKYYKRVLEIDPNYANAHLNLAILKLDAEKDLVAKINALGTSAADNKKYEVLKKQRDDMFTSALPHLEKTVELVPNNIEAVSTLYNVYRALEMEEKAKATKAKLKELQGN